MIYNSVYLHKIFRPSSFKETIHRAVKILAEFDKVTPFKAIAFRGQSGAALGYTLGYLMNKELICVRKHEDGSHNSRLVEGYIVPCDYIIVDDFIDTGSTISEIYENIKEETPGSKLVGVYLYSDSYISDRVKKKIGDIKLIKQITGQE